MAKKQDDKAPRKVNTEKRPVKPTANSTAKSAKRSANGYLPLCRKEMEDAGICQPDFVYICGDAYVDHPSFGAAIICRQLQAYGYTVCLICQPDYRNSESITEYGEPRLGFLVSSGNMDSMVNHYTVAKKRRSQDAYTAGGEMGKRPDYAVIVYCNLIRQQYKKTPIVIGGIEASLRRMSHYDYWSDKVRRSILLDSGADLISYGMGERSIVEIADALQSGMAAKDITYIPGTVFKTRDTAFLEDAIRLPDFEAVRDDKREYAKSFQIQHKNTDPFRAKKIYETYDGSLFVVQNPPAKPLSMQEMDDVYDRPYQRDWHPSYDALGGVPAFGEIRFSLTSNRGCYGDCNFCALTFHEGRIVQARSHASIIKEAEGYLDDPNFKGYIHDVGGPTAEFRAPACSKQMKNGACQNRRCLFPKPCPNLNADHSDYIALLRKLRALPKVKKVFVRSGIRFDYLLADQNREFLKELCKYHVSGQLRVAPEHVSERVLSKMGKPSHNVYLEFVKQFEAMNQKLGLQQYAIPYLMSSHPGSDLKDAIELAQYLRKIGYTPEQVQDFYPTPGTVSTCMYYTGLDPETMEPVYVAKNPHEKAMQRALMQFRRPENYELVKEALLREHRQDLIGFGPECLIGPRPMKANTGKESSSKTAGRKTPGTKTAGRKTPGTKTAGRKTSDVKTAGRKTGSTSKRKTSSTGKRR